MPEGLASSEKGEEQNNIVTVLEDMSVELENAICSMETVTEGVGTLQN